MRKFVLASNVVFFKKTPLHITKGGIVFGSICGASFGFPASQGTFEDEFQEFSLEEILKMDKINLCKRCRKIASKM